MDLAKDDNEPSFFARQKGMILIVARNERKKKKKERGKWRLAVEVKQASFYTFPSIYRIWI